MIQSGRNTNYGKLIRELKHTFFETQPSFGPENQNLMDMLRAPALAVTAFVTGSA